MKKYIVILLSFGLFLIPLGTFAQVDVSACTSATTEDICNAGCEWSIDNTTCTICPQTTYSNDGIYGCKPCIKPTNATFLMASGYEYAGMTAQDECPWTVNVCDENTYIKGLTWRDWNASTALSKDLCSPCDDGQYADNTTQTWENYSLSNPCKPKRFYIVPKLKIQRPDGMITVTPVNSVGDPLSFNYDYKSPDIETIENFQNRILMFMEHQDKISAEEMQNKYSFPPDGTNFILEPQGVGGPSITVRFYATKLGFENFTASMSQFNAYPNHTTFNIPITMVPKKYNICYCSKKPDATHVSSLSNICYCQYNTEFGTMQTASSMTSTMYNVFKKECNGQHLSQWNGHLYTVSTSGYLEHARTFDTPIDVNTQINEPDSSGQFIILTPKYTPCSAGTFSNNPICPTECTPCAAGKFSTSGAFACENCAAGTFSASSGASECSPCAAGTFSAEGSTKCSDCPDGFTTISGAASQDACYIDTTMTFKDNNNKSVTILSSPVYYVGDQ